MNTSNNARPDRNVVVDAEARTRDLLRGYRTHGGFKVLLAEDADVGLATVYRVLMQFEQAGILSRTHFETGKAVFELNEG